MGEGTTFDEEEYGFVIERLAVMKLMTLSVSKGWMDGGRCPVPVRQQAEINSWIEVALSTKSRFNRFMKHSIHIFI